VLPCGAVTEAAGKPPSRRRRSLKRVALGLLALVVVLAAVGTYGVYRPIARRSGQVLAAAQAPDFSLSDQTGVTTSLTTLTAHGPAVLVFYRGFW
jgi:cytochrome oxidase Cu insertion factor (SCO1/SenC/PrrC family)